MNIDKRSKERIERTISCSRLAFDDVTYERIDITDMSAEEAAERIIYK